MSDTIRWCFTHETRWYDDPCGGSEHDDDCDVALLVRADQPVWRLDSDAIDNNMEWGSAWFLPKIDIMVREGVLVRIGAEI